MTQRTRKPMTTPTKNQLAARVAHYETALTALVARLLDPAMVTTVDDSEQIGAELKALLAGAPSLDPADAPPPVVRTPRKRKASEPPADASENLAEGEELVEVEIFVGEEAAE